MYVHHVYCLPGACESQKRALDSLKLELQAVVSHHGGADNSTRS